MTRENTLPSATLTQQQRKKISNEEIVDVINRLDKVERIPSTCRTTGLK